MATAASEHLADLYLSDESSWQERHAERVRAGQLDAIDRENLAGDPWSMSIRDRREIQSRLVVLIEHLLHRRYQPTRRSVRWARTIAHRRMKLADCLESQVLRNHAIEICLDFCEPAVRLAAPESGIAGAGFQAECPFSLMQILEGSLDS